MAKKGSFVKLIQQAVADIKRAEKPNKPKK